MSRLHFGRRHRWSNLIKGSLCLYLLSSFGFAQEIQWQASIESHEGQPRIVVFQASQDQTQSLGVWVGGLNPRETPPLAGTWAWESTRAIFHPRFPLRSGKVYQVGVQLKGQDMRWTNVQPLPQSAPATELEQVFPSVSEVPENLLKLYLQFSGPMRKGDIYSHVKLLNAEGQEIELPFLEIEQEFWSRDSKRLTLLFDPGRIKRGLKPREEMGPILVPGRAYWLVISADWPDAHGNTRQEDWRRKFIAGEADSQQPDPRRWILQPPKSAEAPLRIQFDESLDRAMLESAIGVDQLIGKQWRPIKDLEIQIGKQERSWAASSPRPWASGVYRLNIRADLEDLAGNSIERPFDVDLFQETKPSIPPVTYLEFQID